MSPTHTHTHTRTDRPTIRDASHLLVVSTLFSISKHKANTTELHPKVRQTCVLIFFVNNKQFINEFT